MMRVSGFLFVLSFLMILGVFSIVESLGQQTDKVQMRTQALKLNVDDMPKAVAFYCEKLGFEIEDNRNFPRQVFLRSGDRVKLSLNLVSKLRQTESDDPHVSFTLQVNDLDKAIRRMKMMNVQLDGEPRKEGVGQAIYIRDPFDRRLSLMHVTITNVEPFPEPKIYNFGYVLHSMETARDFYVKKLGFVEYTDRYLPLDMPLRNADKSFGFMLHYRNWIKPIKIDSPEALPLNTIVFAVADLKLAKRKLKESKVKILKTKQFDNFQRTIFFEDPFGNISEIVEIAMEK